MTAPFRFLDVLEPAGCNVMPAPAVAAHLSSLGRLRSCATAQFCDKGMDCGNQGVLRGEDFRSLDRDVDGIHSGRALLGWSYSA